MSSRFQVALVIFVVLASIVTSWPTASGVSEGRLSVQGTSIVNSIGHNVLLRGVNYVGYGVDNPYPEKHSEQVYETFARLGFNVVRLPISWANLEPYPGRVDERYLANYVDNDIRWAKKYGIYLVLSMQQSNWGSRFGGSGVPDWATRQYPPTDQGMREAITDFWRHTANQDHLIELWKKIASRYSTETTIAGYDILNEPWIYTSIVPDLNASYVNNFYLRVTSSIRTVDANHIIVLEPANLYAEFPLKDNIVWSPHFYPLSFAPHYDQTNSGLLEADLAAKWKKFVNESGSPLWIGEFGAFMKDGSSDSWLRDTVRLFGKYGIGWAWWAYDDGTGTIPRPLYETQIGQMTSTELGEPLIGILEQNVTLVFLVVVGVAVLAVIIYEIVHYGRRHRLNE